VGEAPYHSGLAVVVVQAPPVELANNTMVWSEQNVRVPVVLGSAGCAKLV